MKKTLGAFTIIFTALFLVHLWADRLAIIGAFNGRGAIVLNKLTGESCYLQFPDYARQSTDMAGMKNCMFAGESYKLP